MSDVVDGLEGELRSNAISVEAIDVEEHVDLTYLTAFPGTRVNHQEMGRACNTFIDLHAAGEWDPCRVEATVLRADDDVLGTWHIEPEWITGYAEYRLSDEDFSERVLGTLSHAVDEAGGDGETGTEAES
jgi:hypothetical protein